MFTEIIKPDNFKFQIDDCITLLFDGCLANVTIVGYSSNTLLVTVPDKLSN